MLIKTQENNCYIIYLYDLFIEYINNQLAFFSNFIKYFRLQDSVLYSNCVNMIYIKLLYLSLLFFFIGPFIENPKKVFMSYFTIYCIIVFYTFEVSNSLNQMCHSMDFEIIESWLEYFCIN